MANAALKRRRPKYLSLAALLFQLRLPLPGKVSILHRISGALLVFPLAAWLLYLLDQSLASEEGFDHVKDHYLQAPLAKAGLDRKSTRLNSSHSSISYAVFCLKKKKPPQLPC